MMKNDIISIRGEEKLISSWILYGGLFLLFGSMFVYAVFPIPMILLDFFTYVFITGLICIGIGIVWKAIRLCCKKYLKITEISKPIVRLPKLSFLYDNRKIKDEIVRQELMLKNLEFLARSNQIEEKEYAQARDRVSYAIQILRELKKR